MRRVGGLRQVTARDLMFSLCAGLDRFQAASNCEIDRLIIADLKMQERMMLDRAPVPAKQGLGADEINRARNPAPVAARHDQQHVISQAFADQREECAGQIRAAPFSRTRLHVKREKRVPSVLGYLAAGERVDGDAVGHRLAAFAFYRLAMARVQRSKKIVETAVASIVPVKLLVGALKESVRGQELPFQLARK